MAQKTYFEIVTEVDENGISRDYIVESTYDVDNETGEIIGKIGDSVKLEDENGNFIEINNDKINIEPIDKSDTLEDFCEKVDYNFSQLLMHGGGPKGDNGEKGIQGPQGYRGSSIFVFKSEPGLNWNEEKENKVTKDDKYEDGCALAKALKSIKDNPTNYIEGDIFILDSNICKVITGNNDEGVYNVTIDYLNDIISIKGDRGDRGNDGANGEDKGIWNYDNDNQNITKLNKDISKVILSGEYNSDADAFTTEYDSKLYFINEKDIAYMSFVNDGECDMLIGEKDKNISITPRNGCKLTIGNNDSTSTTATSLVLKGGRTSNININNENDNDSINISSNKISLKDYKSIELLNKDVKIITIDNNNNNNTVNFNNISSINVNDALKLSKSSNKLNIDLEGDKLNINSSKISLDNTGGDISIKSKGYSIDTDRYSIDTKDTNDSNISLTVNSKNRIILNKQGISIDANDFKIENSGNINIHTKNSAKLQSDKNITIQGDSGVISIKGTTNNGYGVSITSKIIENTTEKQGNILLDGNVTITGAASGNMFVPKGTIIDFYCPCDYLSYENVPAGYVPCGKIKFKNEDTRTNEFNKWTNIYPTNGSNNTLEKIDNFGIHFKKCNGVTIPDLTDRFIVYAGWTYKCGNSGGYATHTLTLDEIPTHNHNTSTSNGKSILTTSSGGEHTHNTNIMTVNTISGSDVHTTNEKYSGSSTISTSKNGNHTHTVEINPAGGGKSHNNMPPYYAIYKLIKVV